MKNTANNTQRRAAKGGEVGANGEDYKGGQFIANTDRAKGQTPNRRGPRKIEVAPYEWIEVADDSRSIFSMIAGTYGILDRDANTFTLNETFAAFQLRQGMTTDELDAIEILIERYNRGERII